ncbi:MAG: NADH:ubiquinone reductase (Na(+)-transporting) subunit B, partial [Chlamydiia bacterium]|nr:NADH:ubiquinone reductase (Na(+)-transporting) subunit B [Chlamydiia bacterium]
LRKLLDYQLALADKYPLLNKLKPSITALDTFLYEAPVNTREAPHIRDAVDLKRWMSLVVVAMIPAILMALWNTGLQSFVYSSGDYKLMDEYLASLGSFGDYFGFAFKNDRYLTILKEGALAFLPVVLVTYLAGGLTEMAFAIVRRHEVAEGFLVTGMLVPLIMPPTIPLWMVAVGTVVGIVLSKELFGGTGMNIINPALTIRAFMFFTFPTRMSGDVWVGRNPFVVRESLVKMNADAGKSAIDGYSQATMLAKFNIAPEIKQIHVNAIATNNLGDKVGNYDLIQKAFDKWNQLGEHGAQLGKLTAEQLQSFVTSPLAEGGLGLGAGNYADAFHFSALQHGLGELNNNWLLFLGNKLGCMGETSGLLILLGALFIILTGVGSWRTMAAVVLGTLFTASCFEWGSKLLAADGGAFTSAQFGFPAYKMLLLGGLAFGLVYMATDPVSSCDTKMGRWI